MIKTLLIYSPIVIVAIFIIVMVAKVVRSERRASRYKKHLGKLTATIQNPNTPDDTKTQAVKELIKASPENFEKEEK